MKTSQIKSNRANPYKKGKSNHITTNASKSEQHENNIRNRTNQNKLNQHESISKQIRTHRVKTNWANRKKYNNSKQIRTTENKSEQLKTIQNNFEQIRTNRPNHNEP